MHEIRNAIHEFIKEHSKEPVKIILSAAHKEVLDVDSNRRLWMNEKTIRGIPWEIGEPADGKFELQ